MYGLMFTTSALQKSIVGTTNKLYLCHFTSDSVEVMAYFNLIFNTIPFVETKFKMLACNH